MAVASDGSIWFTDPVYGIGGYYEGIKAEPEQEKHNVYRADPRSGRSRLSSMTSSSPTALPFRLTRRSSMSSTPASLTGRTTHRISVCSMWMLGPERCRTAKSLPKCQSPALPTGYARHRRPYLVFLGWGDPSNDGVRCYTPEGELLGKIHIPETVANLCFGGQQRNRLYICGSTSLYAVYTSAQGALKP